MGATPALLGKGVAGLKTANDELDAHKRKMADRKAREAHEDNLARKAKKKPIVDNRTAKRRTAEDAEDEVTLQKLTKAVADWERLVQEVEAKLAQQEAERKRKAEEKAAEANKKKEALKLPISPDGKVGAKKNRE